MKSGRQKEKERQGKREGGKERKNFTFLQYAMKIHPGNSNKMKIRNMKPHFG